MRKVIVIGAGLAGCSVVVEGTRVDLQVVLANPCRNGGRGGVAPEWAVPRALHETDAESINCRTSMVSPSIAGEAS